jgi:hypothetical protein
MADFCSALYCAYAPAETFSPSTAGDIRFTARTVDEGEEAYYLVRLTHLRQPPLWKPPIPLDRSAGDRLELSTLSLEGEPGAWTLWINPYYQREIEISCGHIILNGAEVVGRGRHLQDEVPRSRPALPPYPSDAA